jgi:hypothetical protein
MLRNFSPEKKSDGLGRERNRDLGDGLIAFVVFVTTTAEVQDMPPPISIKPMSLW